MSWNPLTKLKAMLGEIVGAADKFMNQEMFEACMAAVVMVGNADGEFDASEKTKTLAFVTAHPAMKRFNAADIGKCFKRFADLYDLDAGMGKDECWKAIRKIQGAEEDARRLLIRLMILIGGADGKFDPKEQALVKEMCGKLSIRASEFEL